MHVEEIKKLLHSEPFKPFTVYMPNDRAFQIPHPEFAWVTPNGRTMFIASENDTGTDMLEIPLIVRIQVKEQKRSKPKG